VTIVLLSLKRPPGRLDVQDVRIIKREITGPTAVKLEIAHILLTNPKYGDVMHAI
jgi:hypothetical protein